MGADEKSLGNVLRDQEQWQPESVAITFEGRSFTWAELGARSRAVAAALGAAGVGSQDRVAFLEKNSVEFFEFSFGCALANAVNVSVNWRLAAPEVAHIVDDATAKVLIVGPDFFDVVEAIEPDLTTVQTIVAIGDHPRWIHYEDWLTAQTAADPMTRSAPDDVSLQLYTSGTTGLPKGVMLSNTNLFTLFDRVQEPWGFGEDEVNLVAMPLFHIGGAGWAFAGMYGGCRSVLVRDFVPDQVLDVLVDEGVTTALFVPAMLQFMSMVPGAADRTYPVRTIVYGASPITEQVLMDAMNTFKCEFVQLYGMTETTGGFTQLDPEDHDPGGPRAHLLRSAGRPFPWVEVKVVDLDTGQACAPGEVGEVWTRSAQNMLGYWNQPVATTATIGDGGWLRTGDAGYLDDEGYLFLTDRVKDMIVTGGENVYPAEVENVIAAHPAVAEVGVIGIPSDRWGETVAAIVVARPDHDVSAAELIAFCRERLAHYKCPTRVEFTDVLPRNPSGKVLKRDLRQPFWDGQERSIH